MSMWAKPGALCVCIRDDWGSYSIGEFHLPVRVPMLREVLTISDTIFDDHKGLMLAFEEIPLRQRDGDFSADIMFSVQNFRPLITQSDDVAKFTHLLTPQKIEERV